MSSIPYVVTIDTEEEWDWNAGWPVREFSLNNIATAPRFQSLCERLGAKTTWFTNWSVLCDQTSRETMLDLSRRPGVEIGMHIHPWMTPPLAESNGRHAYHSFLRNLEPELIHAKLSSIHRRFRDLELTPRSFRGGRYSSGGTIHDFLLEHRFLVDSSVVPFGSWSDEGAPDFRRRDNTPSRISRNGDSHGLWEVPLTQGYTRKNFGLWAPVHQFVDLPALSRLRFLSVVERLGIVRRVWLNFEIDGARHMLALLRILRQLPVECLVFTVHSTSLLKGCNPYSATAEQVERTWSTAERVLDWVRNDDGFHPATMTEIGEAFEARHRERLLRRQLS